METRDKWPLGLLLHDAARALRRRFDLRAAELGLSTAQWRLLVHLFRCGRISQARLAERLEIEPISVSRLIDRMTEQGWVLREPDPSDRRSRIVVPTDKARNAYDRSRIIADGLYEDALRGMSDDQRDAVIASLRQVIDNLSDGAEGDCACAPPTVAAATPPADPRATPKSETP